LLARRIQYQRRSEPAACSRWVATRDKRVDACDGSQHNQASREGAR
jgi:hypothetical protein